MQTAISIFLFAVIGAALGFSLTGTADRICKFKNKNRGGMFQKSRLFNSIALSTVLAAANTGAWVITGISLKFQPAAYLISLLISLAILISLIDIQIRLIPNELVLTMIVIGAVFQITFSGLAGLITALICMVATGVLFTVTALCLGLEKVGAGDIKLACAVAFALGYPYILSAMVIMGLSIFLFCMIGLMTKRLKKTSMFPYAPFFMLGMVTALVQIINANGIGSL